jgi:hypothetical protein
MTDQGNPILPVPRSAMTDAHWARIHGPLFVELANLTPVERFARSAQLWEASRATDCDMDGPGALDLGGE